MKLKTLEGRHIMSDKYVYFCKCCTVQKSTTTHVVNIKNSIIVIKNIPCEECEQCGAKFYVDEVAVHLEEVATMAKNLCRK